MRAAKRPARRTRGWWVLALLALACAGWFFWPAPEAPPPAPPPPPPVAAAAPVPPPRPRKRPPPPPPPAPPADPVPRDALLSIVRQHLGELRVCGDLRSVPVRMTVNAKGAVRDLRLGSSAPAANCAREQMSAWNFAAAGLRADATVLWTLTLD